MNKIILLSVILISACAELDPYFDVVNQYIDFRNGIRKQEDCINHPQCEIVDGGWIVTDSDGRRVFVTNGKAD